MQKRQFTEAKAWLSDEQKKCRNDKTLFDEKRMDELLAKLRDEAQRIKMRRDMDTWVNSNITTLQAFQEDIKKNAVTYTADSDIQNSVESLLKHFTELKATEASVETINHLE